MHDGVIGANLGRVRSACDVGRAHELYALSMMQLLCMLCINVHLSACLRCWNRHEAPHQESSPARAGSYLTSLSSLSNTTSLL